MLNFIFKENKRNFFATIIACLTNSALAAMTVEDLLANNDLKISNNSKASFTFTIDGICSQELGVIKPQAIKIVSNNNLIRACKKNPENCHALVFPSDNCNFHPIGYVVLDINAGVKQIFVRGQEYSIDGKGFNLFIGNKCT